VSAPAQCRPGHTVVRGWAGLFASHIDYGADHVRSVDSVDIDPLTR